MQEIVSKKKNIHCCSQFAIQNHRPAMPESKATERLFAQLKETAASLGQGLPAEHRRGTSDANFFGAAGIPTLDGFGPVGLRDHTPEERIHIPSLKDRTDLLSIFLLTLSR